MKSIWEDIKMPVFPQLSGDVKTDVLIIGGGMAGGALRSVFTGRRRFLHRCRSRTDCRGHHRRDNCQGHIPARADLSEAGQPVWTLPGGTISSCQRGGGFRFSKAVPKHGLRLGGSGQLPLFPHGPDNFGDGAKRSAVHEISGTIC